MFTYLAIPYTDPDPEVRRARMRGFWLAAAELIRRGDHVVSPMTLEPAYEVDPTLPYAWEAWQHYSITMMGMCRHLVVVKLPGWSESTGVQGEMAEAARLGLTIEFMEPFDG